MVMFKFKKNILILLTITVVIILSTGYLYVNYSQENQYTTFPQISASDRILIFSPHPDDETLGTGGLIKKALERNATVTIVEMTNGDLMTPSQFKNYLQKINITQYDGAIGDLRQTETINAMKTLGLNQENIIFLGYPDGGLKPIFENHWDDNNLFHMDSGSNQFDHSPYNISYEKNAPYSGNNVEKNVEQIMEDYKPTIIFYPDNGDNHPDHLATSAFVSYAILNTNYTGKSYTYLIHQPNWPRIISYPNSKLLIPSIITTSDAEWYVNPLNKTEQNTKRNAIYAYATQTSNMLGYLSVFVQKSEIYAIYPTIIIKKFDGIDPLRYQMPSSSYTKMENHPKTGNKLPYGSLITSGIAYDDKNLYLLLKSNNLLNFEYCYHLKIFNRKTINQLDLKIKNRSAEYESSSNNTIKSDEKPSVQINNDIMIVSLPRSLFADTKFIMMSIDIIDPKKNQEIDYTPWRVFQFYNNTIIRPSSGNSTQWQS